MGYLRCDVTALLKVGYRLPQAIINFLPHAARSRQSRGVHLEADNCHRNTVNMNTGSSVTEKQFRLSSCMNFAI